ncbi:glycosyltransferase family 4 protein [Curtobacterium ammoniigenes]|uniref:glycosyltransferase family 4 protein n=1 Tax=Curtobacterium ammoniigenes TaxID=395387 RepID=UPI0009FA88D0|nr:glycosyltransferase family 4 protein [Curtobacterium ammoniigenes]
MNYAPEVSGIGPYAAGLAEGLAGRGALVRVLTTFAHYPQWKFSSGRPRSKEVSNAGNVRVVRLRHCLPKTPIGISRVFSELSFGVRAILASWDGVSVIVTISPALFSSFPVTLRALLMRKPLVVWAQDLYSPGLRETRKGGRISRWITFQSEKFVLRKATRVVVIHERFGQLVNTEFGVDLARIEIIRNWSHTPLSTAADRANIRRTFGWSENDVVALHSGNMGVKQGLENVVKAAAIADSIGSRVRFVLIGDGSQRKRLADSAIGIGSIEILDPLPEGAYAAALAAADVLLVNEAPGVAEMAVPSKLTAYFGTGRPVVAASNEASITSQEIRAAGAGIVVSPHDPRALLAAIERLADTPEVMKSYGTSGLAFRQSMLTEQLAIDRFANLLKLVTSGISRQGGGTWQDARL